MVQRNAQDTFDTQFECRVYYSLVFPPPEGIKKVVEPYADGKGMGVVGSRDKALTIYTLQTGITKAVPSQHRDT